MEQEISIEKRTEIIAKGLLDLGVDLAVGIPGTGPVLNFLSKFEELGGRFLLCKNEASAPIIAGTIGRKENKPLLAICANGTARINLLSGIAHCWFENLPVIALWDCYSKSTSQYQCLQKLPDHNFNSFFNLLLDGIGNDYRNLAKVLYKSALDPNFGPVGVNLRISDKKPLIIGNYDSCNDSIFNVDDIQSHKKYIKPVMIFGAASALGELGGQIRKEFSDISIPKLTAIGAKGLFTELDEFSLKVFTGVGGSFTPESMVLKEADVIIGVNLRHSDVIKVKAFEKQAFLFDFEKLNESQGFGGNPFLVSSVSELKKNIFKISEPSWTSENCREIHSVSNKHILVKNNTAGMLIHEASKILFGNSTVIVDDGIYQKHSEYLWITDHFKDFISTGVGRNMGSALPAALGLALRYPEENIICLTGDGGLPLFLGELGMLPNQKHGKLLVIHFADFALGTMKTKKLNNLDKLVSSPVSYCEIFNVFGFKSISSDNLVDCMDIVKDWKVNNYDLIIEFKLNAATYPETFNLIR